MQSKSRIVPRYLLFYSIVKAISSVVDLRRGSKLIILEILKLLLIFVRITGVGYFKKRLHFNVTTVSILLETVLFFNQKKHFSNLRLVLEAVFGLLSFFFLIFMHPSYYNDSKGKE